VNNDVGVYVIHDYDISWSNSDTDNLLTGKFAEFAQRAKDVTDDPENSYFCNPDSSYNMCYTKDKAPEASGLSTQDVLAMFPGQFAKQSLDPWEVYDDKIVLKLDGTGEQGNDWDLNINPVTIITRNMHTNEINQVPVWPSTFRLMPKPCTDDGLLVRNRPQPTRASGIYASVDGVEKFVFYQPMGSLVDLFSWELISFNKRCDTEDETCSVVSDRAHENKPFYSCIDLPTQHYSMRVKLDG
jgi:hypothetical protein